jgi:DNA polymerase-3 subunit delta
MAKELTYLDILADLRNKHYKPVYYLMGEEAYFIDLIADFIEENVLTEAEKASTRPLCMGRTWI